MISIILNTYNHFEVTKKYLPKMIESVGCEYELLINDNGSTDGVEKWLDENYKENTVFLKENVGCPTGLNLLISISKGEYIAKIDPDFIMPDNWGQLAIDLLKNDKIGLVGFYWGRGFIHEDLQKGEIVKLDNNIIFVPKKVFGCWVFRREILDKVGLFYDQVKYGNWDSEFNERLKKHGYLNVYHRFDSIHMGEDTEVEQAEKHKNRVNEIPDLLTYKLDEFRAFSKRTD